MSKTSLQWMTQRLTWTSETAMWQVSKVHQSSPGCMTQPCPFGPLFFLSSAAVAEGAAEEAEGTLVQSTPLLLVATPACSIQGRVRNMSALHRLPSVFFATWCCLLVDATSALAYTMYVCCWTSLLLNVQGSNEQVDQQNGYIEHGRLDCHRKALQKHRQADESYLFFKLTLTIRCAVICVQSQHRHAHGEIVLYPPVDPEQGEIASTALPDALLPEYHIYHLCSLSPR